MRRRLRASATVVKPRSAAMGHGRSAFALLRGGLAIPVLALCLAPLVAGSAAAAPASLPVPKEEVRQQQENSPTPGRWCSTGRRWRTRRGSTRIRCTGRWRIFLNAPVQAFVDFFKKYYVPNNATLVICGDFDPKYARTSIEKYYGPLRAGPEIPRTFPPEARRRCIARCRTRRPRPRSR